MMKKTEFPPEWQQIVDGSFAHYDQIIASVVKYKRFLRTNDFRLSSMMLLDLAQAVVEMAEDAAAFAPEESNELAPIVLAMQGAQMRLFDRACKGGQ